MPLLHVNGIIVTAFSMAFLPYRLEGSRRVAKIIETIFFTVSIIFGFFLLFDMNIFYFLFSF